MKPTVLVTGADRGLGLSLAKEFHANGFRVFAGRFLKNWTYITDFAAADPENVKVIDIDISSDESVSLAREAVLKETDSLDVLMNNAAICDLGTYKDGSIFDPSLNFESMQRVINVNAIGTLRVTHAFIDLVMKSKHKLVANISSEAGSVGACWRNFGFAYCMSKTAINMFAAILQNGISGERGGQVMNFEPGGMPTHNNDHTDSADKMLPLAKNDSSRVTCDESAKGIVKMILDHERYKGERPAYLSYKGETLIW